jgi:dTDP-4-dehydrorhamnose 3,5-epimerase-like enzyme
MAKAPGLRERPSISSPLGSLSVLEDISIVPFSIERVYFISRVPDGAERGSHAHKRLEQFIVAVNGSLTVKLDSGISAESFRLDSSKFGLYVPPGFWRDLSDFSHGAVCLVLASTKYDESDYIRNYQEFLLWAGR